MGYRCYIAGVTFDGKRKDDLCLGKCYGYNNKTDGLMLGYTFIMNTDDYKEYRKEEIESLMSGYTDYDIVDSTFTAQGSIDMELTKSDFIVFLDLYLLDCKKVWKHEYDIDSVISIMNYLQDCRTVTVMWF